VGISWCLVTLGRPAIVERAAANVFDAHVISELAWVDNGSTGADYEELKRCLTELCRRDSVPLTSCRYEQNRGSAFGHNRAYAIATGDAFFSNDGDIELPPRGLQDMADVLERDPKRMSVSLWCYPPYFVPERFYGPEFEEALPSGRTLKLRLGLPMGPRLFRRELLSIAGWIHEGFGKCEWDDVEWSSRVKERCMRLGLQSLAITSAMSTHIPNIGAPGLGEDEAYRVMKASESHDPTKVVLLGNLASRGYPSFDPWAPQRER